MARIRSIHPGLFTDESYMALGVCARQLLIGIWCEAWDDGVFEWKPLTLKARIFPVDTVDVSDLLDELVAQNVIKPFEQSEKRFGAVRNFRKYQRPKKPNTSGFLPPEFSSYVGLTAPSSEPVGNQFGTGGEKSPQMEDGGGRKKEKKEKELPTGSSKKKSELSPRQELEKVLGSKLSKAILDHRQKLRKPLSRYAAQLLAAKFAKTEDPNAAARMMIERGWQGFEAEWMPNQNQPRGSPAKPSALDALDATILEMERRNGNGQPQTHSGHASEGLRLVGEGG